MRRSAVFWLLVASSCAAPPAPRVVDGFAWIPPGAAKVGDELGVGQEDERPLREIGVDGYWLATTETTNAEFAAFLNAIGEPSADWCDFESRKFRIRRGADGAWSTDAPELPVVTVAWTGAVAYCDWLSARLGRRCRLPSEVEWEKAARGPDGFVYSYGNVFTTAAANQESGKLLPVGQFAPNGYGLFDMTGNAFEWTADWYARDAYRVGAPPMAGEYRVLRGGSFVLDGMFLRNSMRMKLRPQVRADDVGFRVAMDAEELR